MIKKGDQLLDSFVIALKFSVDNVSLMVLSAADPALASPLGMQLLRLFLWVL